MLTLVFVQVLAGCSLAAIMGGFVLGHSLPHPPRENAQVVARKDPGRWTEAAWVGGSLIVAFWSIGVLLDPSYSYHWPTFPDFPESGAFQLLGFSVSIAGGLLFFAATRALGRHMTAAIQVREGHRLVQEGPYRYIRHPVYTAIIAAAGGQSLLYLSPVLALVVLVLAGLAIYRARLEEELLSSPKGFGPDYLEYVARTGRFLPRIRSQR
jgi:protein-S-isoprenylcysteine O-methyltransferase Ste14